MSAASTSSPLTVAGRRVQDMSSLFEEAGSFNQDLSGWDVKQCRYLNKMFLGALAFKGNLSNWKVTINMDVTDMFVGARNFKSDLRQWNVGSFNVKLCF